MIQKLLGALLLFALTATAGFAQNDWREGYIIQNSGDTIQGFVDYRDFKSNSQLCYFKSSEKAGVQKLEPGQIHGYRYENGKYYVSKKVPFQGEEKEVFLEFLLKGLVNVYYYNHEGADYYFVEKDNKVYELKNSEKVLTVDGQRYLREQKEYIGLLSFLLQDAPIKKEIQNSDFNSKSFKKIARKYHEEVCTTGEKCVVFEKESKPIRISYGITLGMDSRTLYLYYKPGIYAKHDIRKEFTEFGGFVFNVQNIPGMYERFSLQLEILGSSYFYRKGGTSTYYRDDRKRYALNIPLLLSYRVLATKVYPKIEAGISSYTIHSKEIESQYVTLVGGVSLNYNYHKDFNLFINARYERDPNIIRFGGGLMF